MTLKRKSDCFVTSSPNVSPSTVKRLHYDNDYRQKSNRAFSSRKEKPTVDKSSGQTSAFPGLDDGEDDDDDDEQDDSEDKLTSTKAAMRYLRRVRNEAKSIPKLLVAPLSDTKDDTEDAAYDTSAGSGYYEDGAYIAAPAIGPLMPSKWKERCVTTNDAASSSQPPLALPSPQEAYTQQLLANFGLQKRQLRSIRNRSKKGSDIVFRGGFQALNDIIFKTVPDSDRVAALSQETILHILGTAKQSLKRHCNLSQHFSAWIWAVLCALDDVGTLDSDAVSVVRELAKKAVWIGIGFMSTEAATATEAYDEEDDHGEQIEPDGENHLSDLDPATYGAAGTSRTQVPAPEQSCAEETVKIKLGRRRNTSSPEPPAIKVMEEARASNSALRPSMGSEEVQLARDKLLTSLARTLSHESKGCVNVHEQQDTSELCPNANTCATIDMIITITGEAYGQRDLLEFRSVWSGLWG